MASPLGVRICGVEVGRWYSVGLERCREMMGWVCSDEEEERHGKEFIIIPCRSECNQDSEI